MPTTIRGALRRIARRSGRATIGIVLTCGLLLAHPVPAMATAPVAQDQTFSLYKDSTAFVSLYAGDDDGDSLTYEVVTPPTHGGLTSCSAEFTYCEYTPDAGYFGPDSFTFRSSDGATTSNTATVTITVLDPDAPVAYGAYATAAPGSPVDVELSGYDPDEGDLTFSIVSGPASGTLGSIGPVTCDYVDDSSCRTTVAYTAGAGTAGFEDTFTYRVTNTVGSPSEPATATLTIVDPGAPTAYDTSLSAGKDTTTTLTVSGSDGLDRDLTFAAVGSPAHGTLSAFHDTTCDGGFCESKIDYTTAGYVGPDSFTFTVAAGGSRSTPATVELDVDAPPCAGKVITNGTVKLGVNCKGELNVDGIGLQFVPTGNDSTSPGCACEGWGAGDTTSTVSGWANRSSGNSDNLTQVSFETTATTAVSVVDIGSTFRVTHDYHPSPSTPNAYEVSVSVKNISTAATHLRYRRVMDWDIEPTAFGGFVTLFKGSSPFLDFTSNNGFATSNPLAGPSDIGQTGSFADAGPDDHGALFDFDFGSLAPGATREFTTFYGSAATETGAINALNAVGVEAYSLGEPSTRDGPTLGTPNTFLFGFRDIGGADIFAPDTVNDSLTTTEDTPGDANVLGNDTDPNGDTLSVTGKANGAHGTVSCTGPGVCTYTPDANHAGPDSFTYTISDGNGGTDTGTVNVAVTPVNDAPVAVADSTTTPEDTAKAIAVLGNDRDVDGDSLTVTGKTDGAHGTVSCTTTTCAYTPATGYSGPDSFTYTISDGNGGTDTATVTVTVTAGNRPPVATDEDLTTAEDTAGGINVLANDTDPDTGTTLTLTARTNGAHGTVSCAPGGSCTYTPEADYKGPDSFTYTVTDGTLTDVGTVNVAVTPVNDAPVAVADTTTTAEDTAKVIAVPANDTDVDNATLTAVLVTGAAHGTVSCSAGGCTYTPAANYSGPDSFTYRASDGSLRSNVVTVTITVTPVNDAPDAGNDSLTTTEDTTGAVSVLGNDADIDGGDLRVTGTTDGARGTVSCGPRGSCTYTPVADYDGPDSFTYTVSDGNGGKDTGTVNVGVTPVNDAPVAVGDTTTTAEDAAKTIDVTANDTDVDGPSIAAVLVAGATHGTVSCTAGSCTYTPVANYHGPDSFTYRATDGSLQSSPVTASITVTPVNDAPVAVDDTATTDARAPVAIPVLTHDTDVDGGPLTVSGRTDPEDGTVVCTATTCTYTPTAGFTGEDTFTYTVRDGGSLTDTGLVTVSVGRTNAPPEPVGDLVTTKEDTVALFNALTNDTDPEGDPLTVTLVPDQLPTGGTVTCTSAGACTYRPDADFNGDDQFQYRVADDHGNTVDATVEISITPVNDIPVAADDGLALKEDTSTSVTVLTNDDDVDGDALTVTGKTNGSHGKVTCSGAGTCTYAPVKDYSGPDSFTYTVRDGQGGTDVGTVNVTVHPVADRPGASRIGGASPGAAGGRTTITCRWSAPRSDGGAPITAYKVSVKKLNSADRVVSRSTFSVGATKRSLSVNRLDGRYLCRVSATNRVGIGPQSGASDTVRSR